MLDELVSASLPRDSYDWLGRGRVPRGCRRRRRGLLRRSFADCLRPSRRRPELEDRRSGRHERLFGLRGSRGAVPVARQRQRLSVLDDTIHARRRRVPEDHRVPRRNDRESRVDTNLRTRLAGGVRERLVTDHARVRRERLEEHRDRRVVGPTPLGTTRAVDRELRRSGLGIFDGSALVLVDGDLELRVVRANRLILSASHPCEREHSKRQRCDREHPDHPHPGPSRSPPIRHREPSTRKTPSRVPNSACADPLGLDSARRPGAPDKRVCHPSPHDFAAPPAARQSMTSPLTYCSPSRSTCSWTVCPTTTPGWSRSKLRAACGCSGGASAGGCIRWSDRSTEGGG